MPAKSEDREINKFVGAARTGNVGFVKEMISKGIDINAKNKYGSPALTLASHNGHLSIVEILLNSKANVNVTSKDGITSLMGAAVSGNKSIVEVLLKHGADVNARTVSGDTALMEASHKGYKDVVELLLNSGADANVKDDRGDTAWTIALDQGHNEVLELLEEFGIHINLNIEDTLILEAGKGNKNIVESFLNKGIDSNAKTKSGLTALMNSAQNGHKDIVKLLLDKGAFVNARNRVKETALMRAVERGHEDVVELLLKRRADINAEELAGFSCLLLAVYEGHKNIVELLLKNGAKVNATEPLSERTVLTIAKERGHIEIAKLLDKWGAIEYEETSQEIGTKDVPKSIAEEIKVKELHETEANIPDDIHSCKLAKVNEQELSGTGVDTKNAIEATELLMDNAIHIAPTISKDEVFEEYISVRSSWGSLELIKGSLLQVKRVILKNLERYSSNIDFQKFTVNVYSDQICSQVNAILNNPLRFVGIRVWSTKDFIYCCGNATFDSALTSDVNISDSSASSSDAQSAHDICAAARDGNELVVKELIGKGANINSTGGRTLDFSPLMWASNEGNISMMRLLLDKGADPNLRNRRGAFALMLAAAKGHLDAVRLLLDMGANVHLETQGESALSAAAAYGHLDVVRMLLERGARDNKGWAYEGASQIGHQEIMNLLKQGGR